MSRADVAHPFKSSSESTALYWRMIGGSLLCLPLRESLFQAFQMNFDQLPHRMLVFRERFSRRQSTGRGRWAVSLHGELP